MIPPIKRRVTYILLLIAKPVSDRRLEATVPLVYRLAIFKYSPNLYLIGRRLEATVSLVYGLARGQQARQAFLRQHPRHLVHVHGATEKVRDDRRRDGPEAGGGRGARDRGAQARSGQGGEDHA